MQISKDGFLNGCLAKKKNRELKRQQSNNLLCQVSLSGKEIGQNVITFIYLAKPAPSACLLLNTRKPLHNK